MYWFFPFSQGSLLKDLHPGVNYSNMLRAAFFTNVFCTAFMCLELEFVIFWRKDLGAKPAHKMLVKLSPGCQKNQGKYNSLCLFSLSLRHRRLVSNPWTWDNESIVLPLSYAAAIKGSNPTVLMTLLFSLTIRIRWRPTREASPRLSIRLSDRSSWSQRRTLFSFIAGEVNK